MTSHEDMESIIQEWMAESLSAVDLAKTYAVCTRELDKQLEYCMGNFTKEDSDDKGR